MFSTLFTTSRFLKLVGSSDVAWAGFATAAFSEGATSTGLACASVATGFVSTAFPEGAASTGLALATTSVAAG